MKKTYISFVGISLMVLSGCSIFPENEDNKPKLIPTNIFKNNILYQVSTINQLYSGNYNPYLSTKDLKNKGDFGIGTFEGLDGEMAYANGNLYQIDYSGNVNLIYDNNKIQTPFAMVNYFKYDTHFAIDNPMNCEGIKNEISKLINDKNKIYALRIIGEFENATTRSVPKQSKPYPGLLTVLEKQNKFEIANSTGDMIGYYMPEYLSGINTPGFHFHFLTQNRKQGGHLLDCKTKKIKIYIDEIDEFQLHLPTNTNN